MFQTRVVLVQYTVSHQHLSSFPQKVPTRMYFDFCWLLMWADAYGCRKAHPVCVPVHTTCVAWRLTLEM